jgi:hypothetical protein
VLKFHFHCSSDTFLVNKKAAEIDGGLGNLKFIFRVKAGFPRTSPAVPRSGSDINQEYDMK